MVLLYNSKMSLWNLKNRLIGKIVVSQKYHLDSIHHSFHYIPNCNGRSCNRIGQSLL